MKVLSSGAAIAIMNEAGRSLNKSLKTIIRSTNYENVNDEKGLASRSEELLVLGRLVPQGIATWAQTSSCYCAQQQQKVSFHEHWILECKNIIRFIIK